MCRSGAKTKPVSTESMWGYKDVHGGLKPPEPPKTPKQDQGTKEIPPTAFRKQTEGEKRAVRKPDRRPGSL